MPPAAHGLTIDAKLPTSTCRPRLLLSSTILNLYPPNKILNGLPVLTNPLCPRPITTPKDLFSAVKRTPPSRSNGTETEEYSRPSTACQGKSSCGLKVLSCVNPSDWAKRKILL